MLFPPVIHDEEKRLKLIDRYQLDEIGSEKPFDHLAKTAALVFDVPIALVSIVAESEQVFEGNCGMDADGTLRDQAFCAFALDVDGILLVEDAQLDERFRNNPLVTGDPRIRFYAGAPIRLSEGSAVGTLCIIDTRPRYRYPSAIVLTRANRNS